LLHNSQIFHWTRLENTQGSLNTLYVCSLNTLENFQACSLHTLWNVTIPIRVQGTCLKLPKRVQRTHLRSSVFREHAWVIFKQVPWNICKLWSILLIEDKELNIKISKQRNNLKIVRVHVENTDLISKMIKKRPTYLVSDPFK
jgi:hypothetical protein